MIPLRKLSRDSISLYAKPNTRDWKGSQRLLQHFAEAWKGRPLAAIGKAKSIGSSTASLPVALP